MRDRRKGWTNDEEYGKGEDANRRGKKRKDKRYPDNVKVDETGTKRGEKQLGVRSALPNALDGRNTRRNYGDDRARGGVRVERRGNTEN